jgi:hypothetical protein
MSSGGRSKAIVSPALPCTGIRLSKSAPLAPIPSRSMTAYRTTAVAAIDRQLQVGRCAARRAHELAVRSRAAAVARAGNPVFDGRYADPEVRVFDNKYWIYPTYSAPYGSRRSWTRSRPRIS